MWKTHDSDRTSERAREREPNTPEKIAEPPLVAVPANPVPTLSTCGKWYHHTEIIKIIKSNRKPGKLQLCQVQILLQCRQQQQQEEK